MKVKPIPEGFNSLTPYLMVDEASKLISFLKKAFDAKEIEVYKDHQGKVAHATMQIGDSRIMLGQTNERAGAIASMLFLYVKDADAIYKKALSAGGTSAAELKDQFWGDRSGAVKDPTGNTWWVSTHVEDVTPKEMQKRMEESMSQLS